MTTKKSDNQTLSTSDDESDVYFLQQAYEYHECLVVEENSPVLTRNPIHRDREGVEDRLMGGYFDDPVIHETTATGLWLKLESLYMTKSLANKLRLKYHLYTFRIKPCTSVQDHLDEFNTIFTDLENLDVDIDNEDKAVLLYDDDVEPESGEGLVARGRSSERGESSNKNKKHRSQSRGKYSNKSCKYWKKLGHIVSDCYKLKNKLKREGKGNNKKKPEKAAKVAVAKGDFDGDVYSAIDTEKYRDELIVDSGYTFHMISHRSWFTTHESFNGGNVYMGNHSIYLKRNLIHLSTLEANGCKYSGEGGDMKIFKGALVLMKAIQSGKKIKKLRTDNGLEFYGESFITLCRKYGIARHHILVRTPQQNGVAERMNRTIMEKVRCNSVDYSNIKVFGCPVYVHVNEGKLVPRVVKCIFLGYGSGVKGCRVWCLDPKYRKIIHSRDVTVNEDVIINPGKDFVPPHNVDNNHREGKVEFEFDVKNSTHTQPPFNDEDIKTQDDGNMPTSPQSQPRTEYLLARDRVRRQVNRPPRLEDYQGDLVAYAFAAAAHIEYYEPTNYLEAISSPECDKWVVAMEEEVKDGIRGVESNRYKARYVVHGFDQREGIDFNELDVKTTFLHGHLEEEIYVEQPGRFKVPGKEDHVCRLKKSLYGLKQSPRQWYKRFDSFMIGHGYDRCSYDECVYLRKFSDGSFLYLVLYVDDMLIVAPNKDQIRELKDQLSNEFDMKDLGAAKRILGMEIRRDRKIGTSNIGLSFEKGRASPNGVVGYADSDYAGDLDARKSLSSYIFYHCGSAISWYSSLQAITTLSTTEAEYISSTEGVKEAIWLRGMINEFGLPQELALLVFDTLRGAVTTTMKTYGFWFKVEIVGIETKTLHVDMWMIRQVWGNTHFDFASMSARGMSGECLWIPNNLKIMWIAGYAPQSLLAKVVLWASLDTMIANWDGILVTMGDFNESNDGIVEANGLISFKKKLQHLRGAIREWIATKRLDSSKLKNEHLSRLSSIDVKINHDNGTDLDFLNRRESSRILGDLDRIAVFDLAQKARIKWASKDSFPKGRNSSFIALIPKVPNATLVTDFFPISLIGCQYKIVSKILANRLSMVIGSCISPEQSAFIKRRSILDGPFILNEVIEWYRKRKKKIMIFKVDFEKAFDSLRWDFLELVMAKLGFGTRWRNWIKGCLRHARSSVLVNGSHTIEFGIFRGLRQGDPLSPFLFILAMEGLHTLTCKALDNGIFTGAYIGNDNLRISHPIYADDVIFSGCRALKLPLKYLGVPVGCNISRYTNWDAIINKFSYKLSRWKACMISVGGRLTLIKSVLSSLATYFMSLYKVPTYICSKLESMRNNFFIGGDTGVEKMTWVSWNKCLASKKLGGIGVGSIFGLNAIHGHNGGIHADPRHSSSHGTWCGILSMVNSLKSKGIDLLSLCTRKLGNGSSIRFWDDAWCGNRPLKVLFPRVHLLDIDKGCQVVDQISSNDWNSFLRRPAEGGIEAAQLSSLQNLIKDVVLSDGCNTWMNLDKKGIDVDSILCPICNDDVETVNHLFFSCDMAKDLWSLLVRWLTQTNHTHNMASHLKGVKKTTMTDEIRRALCKHNKDNPSLTQKQLQEWVHSNYDNMTFENSDEGGESTQELQNLIKELGYRNAMDVEDVLTHPEENVVAQLLTDEEIIESVIGINKDDIDEEDDESSTMEPPSRNEAIKAAITLNNFLLSYEKTTPEVLTMLRKIRDEIQGEIDFNKKQKTIESFFKKPS
nr:retrotransposon protein, putative, Ty1-copia subclass [Tanacetum cinerariifolium]